MFCLQWKKNLFNHQKVSKYYEHDCSFDDFLKYIFKILDSIQWSFHCVKSVQMRSYFWSVFSCIRTEYWDFLCKSPYLVRIQENTEQKKLRIWTLFTELKSNLINLWGIKFLNIFNKILLRNLTFSSSILFLKTSSQFTNEIEHCKEII